MFAEKVNIKIELDKIVNLSELYKFVDEIRLFGSSLRCDSPQDIDLMIIMKGRLQGSKVAFVRKCCHKLRKSKIFSKEINVLLLDSDEFKKPGKVLKNISDKSVII